MKMIEQTCGLRRRSIGEQSMREVVIEYDPHIGENGELANNLLEVGRINGQRIGVRDDDDGRTELPDLVVDDFLHDEG